MMTSCRDSWSAWSVSTERSLVTFCSSASILDDYLNNVTFAESHMVTLYEKERSGGGLVQIYKCDPKSMESHFPEFLAVVKVLFVFTVTFCYLFGHDHVESLLL